MWILGVSWEIPWEIQRLAMGKWNWRWVNENTVIISHIIWIIWMLWRIAVSNKAFCQGNVAHSFRWIAYTNVCNCIFKCVVYCQAQWCFRWYLHGNDEIKYALIKTYYLFSLIWAVLVNNCPVCSADKPVAEGWWQEAMMWVTRTFDEA